MSSNRFLMALFISFVSLYMTTIMLVLWDPPRENDESDHVSTIASNSSHKEQSVETNHRNESVIVANTSMISILVLVSLARLFSYIGNYVVRLLRIALEDQVDDGAARESNKTKSRARMNAPERGVYTIVPPSNFSTI